MCGLLMWSKWFGSYSRKRNGSHHQKFSKLLKSGQISIHIKNSGKILGFTTVTFLAIAAKPHGPHERSAHHLKAFESKKKVRH